MNFLKAYRQLCSENEQRFALVSPNTQQTSIGGENEDKKKGGTQTHSFSLYLEMNKGVSF